MPRSSHFQAGRRLPPFRNDSLPSINFPTIASFPVGAVREPPARPGHRCKPLAWMSRRRGSRRHRVQPQSIDLLRTPDKRGAAGIYKKHGLAKGDVLHSTGFRAPRKVAKNNVSVRITPCIQQAPRRGRFANRPYTCFETIRPQPHPQIHYIQSLCDTGE